MWEEATRGNISLDQEANKTGMVQRLLSLAKAWSSNSILSGLSIESSVDLGMSLPSTVGHSDHEMPPKMVKYVAIKGPC